MRRVESEPVESPCPSLNGFSSSSDETYSQIVAQICTRTSQSVRNVGYLRDVVSASDCSAVAGFPGKRLV